MFVEFQSTSTKILVNTANIYWVEAAMTPDKKPILGESNIVFLNGLAIVVKEPYESAKKKIMGIPALAQ